MKLWHITFSGIYPVGAAAVVVTRDDQFEHTACSLFREAWSKQYPMHDPEPVEARLLDGMPNSVHILVTGDY